MRNSDKPLAVQEARRQGFGVIRLYTNVTMTENIALYPRLGYVERHRGEEKGYLRIYMQKHLSERSCQICTKFCREYLWK